MLQPKPNLSSNTILFIAILLLIIPLFFLEYRLLPYTDGKWIYPYDEAYLRMATAKNLALHGAWGLSGDSFNPVVPSLLYPALLAACYKLTGLHLVIPFMVNLIAALIFVVWTQRWLHRQGIQSWRQLFILATLILLTPLPVLVMTGMEHTLHLLFTFLFITRFCEWWKGGKHTLRWDIYVWGILLTTTRYEGLFLVAIVCLVLLIKRRFLYAILLGVISALPLILFGIFSQSKEAFFLPTSIVLKAIPIPLNGETIQKFVKDDLFTRLVYIYNTYGSIATGRVLFLLPIMYGLFFRRLQEQPMLRNILLCCLGVTILHMAFASSALFFRYEAYLIASALLVPCILLFCYGKTLWPPKGGGARLILIGTFVLLFYPFFSRAWTAHKELNAQCLNTYEQAWQAAGFIHQYYNDAPVITEDIGVTAYQSDGKKLDAATGMGDVEIARSRVEDYYRPEYIDFLLKRYQPRLAIIPERKYYSIGLLQHWKKVADLFNNTKVLFHEDHISIYAVDTTLAPTIKKQLQTYQPSLSPAVRIVYQ